MSAASEDAVRQRAGDRRCSRRTLPSSPSPLAAQGKDGEGLDRPRGASLSNRIKKSPPWKLHPKFPLDFKACLCTVSGLHFNTRVTLDQRTSPQQVKVLPSSRGEADISVRKPVPGSSCLKLALLKDYLSLL